VVDAAEAEATAAVVVMAAVAVDAQTAGNQPN